MVRCKWRCKLGEKEKNSLHQKEGKLVLPAPSPLTKQTNKEERTWNYKPSAAANRKGEGKFMLKVVNNNASEYLTTLYVSLVPLP